MSNKTPSLDHINRQPLVGIDERGCEHRFDQYQEIVYVLAEPGDGLEHVENLQPRQLSEWVTYVADKRGWADCRYVSDGGIAMLAKRLATLLRE